MEGGQSFDTSNGTGAGCCPEILGVLDNCERPAWAVEDDREAAQAPEAPPASKVKSPPNRQPRKFWNIRGGNRADAAPKPETDHRSNNGSIVSDGSAKHTATDQGSDHESRDEDREFQELNVDYDMFAASTTSSRSRSKSKPESKLSQQDEDAPPSPAPIASPSPRNRLAVPKLFGRRGQRQSEQEVHEKKVEQADAQAEMIRQKELADAHAEMKKSKWDTRTERKELFDVQYQRSRGEEHEVAVLAQSLGVSKPTRNLMAGRPSRAATCLFPPADQIDAVVMRQGRGRVYDCTTHFASNMKDMDRAREQAHPSNLHLLTTGLAIMPRTPEELAQEAKLAAGGTKVKGEKSMGGAIFSGSKKLVGGVVNGTTKLVKDTGNLIIGGNQLRLEPIPSITAVLDLALCSVQGIRMQPKLVSAESVDDDDDESGDGSEASDSKSALFADDAICIAADAKTYFVFFDNPEEKAFWLESLQAAVVGQNQDETQKDKMQRLSTIMRINAQSAAFYGDEDMLDRIIKVAKDKIDEPDSFGRYALHYAISMKQNMCITILLDAGAKVNIQDESGQNLAQFAMRHDNARALQMLEASGLELSAEEREALDRSLALPPQTGTGRETGSDNAEGETTANGAMSDAMKQMQERGEKLEELQNKAGNLKDAAQNYSNFAKELKKKAQEEEQRKVFGIF